MSRLQGSNSVRACVRVQAAMNRGKEYYKSSWASQRQLIVAGEYSEPLAWQRFEYKRKLETADLCMLTLTSMDFS